MKTWIWISALALLLVSSSCASYFRVQEKSRFSTADIIPGISKKEFVEKYGDPTTRDVSYDENKILNETLYYKESYRAQVWTVSITAFYFKDGKLVEQKVVKEQNEYNSCNCSKKD